MMGTVNVTIRMDESVKMQAEQVFSELGLNMSVALNVFVKTVARERRIPFDLALNDPFYSETNMKRLEHSLNQSREGKVITKTMSELEAMEQ
jgi:DNA-damage-inducible protein J